MECKAFTYSFVAKGKRNFLAKEKASPENSLKIEDTSRICYANSFNFSKNNTSMKRQRYNREMNGTKLNNFK